MNRAAALEQLGERFDVLVIGGGATGLGAAVDAAARGYRTALIESEDFAKATSSRSTKLIHGGVRYLRNGQLGLVREALHERTYLFNNAPHLVRDLPFIIPAYSWSEVPYYSTGLAMYDLLAGRSNLPRSSILTAREAVKRIPGLNAKRLRAAILYHDGQFDDARLALTLARTAVDHGATVANYTRAKALLYDGGKICGVTAVDCESGHEIEITARVVINATGIFVDAIRSLDRATANLLTHSRGTHIVVPTETLGTTRHAIIVPKTSDNRVIFMTPWHGHVIVGTTDIPTTQIALDPVPTQEEVNYIVQTINPYLARPISEADVSAVFAGLRPLVNRRAASSARRSREHIIDVSPSGLVTIAGGKWTTYRKMAEEVIDTAATFANLTRTTSPTASMALRGATTKTAQAEILRPYGTDAAHVLAIAKESPDYAAPLHPRLPYIGAQVVYAARSEMARMVDDVLARRTRALFLDAQAARESAPTVARLLAKELGHDQVWQAQQLRTFAQIASRAAISH